MDFAIGPVSVSQALSPIVKFITSLIAAPQKQLAAKSGSYYVVIRGITPNIYNSPTDALDNICGIEGAYIEEYPTWIAAAAAWRQVLHDHLAIPLPDPAEPSHGHDTTVSFLSASEISIPHDESLLWHRPAHLSGPKWVVWNSQEPGIYDSWPEAHAQIHGMPDSTSRYQLFRQLTAAEHAWERLEAAGKVVCQAGDAPEYISGELERCVNCGNGWEM